MKTLRLNLLLAAVVVTFLVLWLLPLGVLLFRPAIYAVVPLVALFGVVTWRLWRAWRAIPDALQPKTPPGVQLRESDAPELFALAASVKAYAGTKSVVECWCDISGTISAVAYAEHVAADAKVALRNGIAALAVMTRHEIETLLRYHLAILTFSPRLMSWALKGRMVSDDFFYFAP